MPWASQFIEDLARMPSDPVFVVHFLEFPAPIAGHASSTPGTELKLASHAGYGDVVGMGMELSVGGSSVMPVEWRYTTGTASVVFNGEELNTIGQHVRRGQIARILMGFQGYAFEDFEPIFIGRVLNIQGSPPSWQISFLDAMSLLQNRWDTGSTLVNAFALFSDAEKTTTLDGSYSSGDTTVTVASTTNFSKSNVAKGMFKITPSSGEPFFLSYTGKSSTQFTTVSGSGQHGTTAVNASSGDTVTNVPLIPLQDPIDLFAQILISDGTLASSPPNVLPYKWGYAVPPEFIDQTDMANQQLALGLSSGTYILEWKATEIATSPLSFIQEKLLANGIFPVVRQGQFTVRAIQYPDDAEVTTGIEITDDEIVDISWYAFAPNAQVEYQTVQVQDASGTSGPIDTTYTFPVEYQKLYDMSDQLWTNQAAVRANILSRVQYWGRVVPYQVEVDCAGLRLAQLCPGDIVEITSDHIRAGLGTSAEDGWTKRAAMVLSVNANFIAGLVSLSLAVIPLGDAQT